MIVIGPSRILRFCVLSIWGVGALLISIQPFVWGWLGQVLWTGAILYWVVSTCGLNVRDIVLETDKRELGLVLDGRSVPLTVIQAGVVTKSLVTFELQTADSSFAVMATRDNVTAEGHWRLRRLLLERT